MVSALIVEDEAAAYENLLAQLNLSDETFDIRGWTRSVSQTKSWLMANPAPDIIFLDVNLYDGCAFDIFHTLTIDTPIIFTTAYDEHAIKAFELNSIAYLLKPIVFFELEKAINKFKRLSYQVDTNFSEKLSNLSNTSNLEATQRFLVYSGNEFCSIPPDNIAYFYSDESSFCVSFEGRTYSTRESLTDIHEKLSNDAFFRINRKVIANRNAIACAKRTLGGKLRVMLTPEPSFSVTVSREKSSIFKRWLNAG